MRCTSYRRRLVGASLLAASACFLCSLPTLSQTQPRVYRFDPTFPSRLPRIPGYGRAEVTCVAADAQRIYAGQRTQPWILVFDHPGKYLYGIGKAQLTRPHSVRVDPEGNVWVVD